MQHSHMRKMLYIRQPKKRDDLRVQIKYEHDSKSNKTKRAGTRSKWDMWSAWYIVCVDICDSCVCECEWVWKELNRQSTERRPTGDRNEWYWRREQRVDDKAGISLGIIMHAENHRKECAMQAIVFHVCKAIQSVGMIKSYDRTMINHIDSWLVLPKSSSNRFRKSSSAWSSSLPVRCPRSIWNASQSRINWSRSFIRLWDSSGSPEPRMRARKDATMVEKPPMVSNIRFASDIPIPIPPLNKLK